jgi:cytolysin-activating lysine-acyltransferase
MKRSGRLFCWQSFVIPLPRTERARKYERDPGKRIIGKEPLAHVAARRVRPARGTRVGSAERSAGRETTACDANWRRSAGAPPRAAGSPAGGLPSGRTPGESHASNQNGGPGGPGKNPFSHEPPEGHAKTMSAVLGELVWLMSQSPLHKQFFISDLEWFIMTPALLQQFRTFYATDRPIGVVLWANVSDEVAERLAQGTTKLRPAEPVPAKAGNWKSGDKLWVVEVIAPFGGAEEMVKDLKEKVFPAKPVHFLAVTKDGKQVRVL